MDRRDPSTWLTSHPNFKWRDGMLDRYGARLVLDQWKHPAVEVPGHQSGINLADAGTAGVLLTLLDEEGALTDVVREADGWIVAIHDGEDDIQGFVGDTLGEAAAWALLAWWGEDLGIEVGASVA
ncbi:MAG: hypothetical protein KC656_14760 [Myxococcales bacterium]|nr:hypothetical protein [Myxococcales bacterium]MCB9672084.1 hypothetical protein [Alphaproteobacteria bacterium]MCB9693991.1 hypothetical protein [Alphaproteobacteria bacterium]